MLKLLSSFSGYYTIKEDFVREEDKLEMTDSVQLCLHCGLCCTAYFHEGAKIYTKEDLEWAKKLGVLILEKSDGTCSFALTCPKFDGKCSVYPDRPSVCEEHKCDLLKNVGIGNISLAKAIKISDEMKELCLSLEQALDALIPNSLASQSLITRFQAFHSSGDAVQMQKKYPHLFLKYAVYLRLRNKYFYHKKNDQQ